MIKILRILFCALLFCNFIPFGFSQWQFLGCPDIGAPVDMDAEGDTILVCARSGVFFSDDQAMSWTQINMPDSAIFPYEINVENGHLYLIASTEDFFYSKSLIFRSDDMGENWKDITSILKYHSYFSSYVIQEDTLSIFAGDSVFISYDKGDSYQVDRAEINAEPFIHQNILMSILGNSLYKSQDHGITWDSVYTNEENISLADVSSIDNQLWKTDRISFDDIQVSKSSDHGLTWTIVFNTTGMSSGLHSPIILGQAGKIFLADQSTSDKVYFSGDNGLNWQQKNIPENSNGAFFTKDLLLYLYQKGIYVSSDYGDSFSLANKGFKAASVNGITWNGHDLFINANYSMFKKSVSGQWNELLNAYSMVSTLDGHMLGYIDSAPKRSNNGGNTWVTIPPFAFGYPFYPSFSKLICAGNLMYAISTTESWYSSDYGVTWVSVTGALGLERIELHEKYIASTFIDHVLISDNGIDWQDIRYDLDSPLSSFITAVQYHQGFVFANNPNGLHRLSPSATSWEHLPGPVSVSPVVNFPVFINTFKSYSNLLIAGTHGYGVYISDDNGDTWTDANNGLEDRQVLSSIIIDTDIYIGTQGGIWKRPLSELTLSVTSDPERKLSISVSPNPVKDFLNITINDIGVTNEIYLSLHDSKGTLIKSQNANSPFNIRMNIRDIPSGIYFLQANIENHQGILKVIKN
ncbi:MAG TPA: T9SS type A sorting domain-containing protein [Saprospiraceae bacterium]|nr:T9SS type A sorting domain-containing protein [Saprospiraceae bacterium]